MSKSHVRHPADEEKFQLSVEVPKHVRHDPTLLREWLEAMTVDLLNAEEVQLTERPDSTDVGGDDWVSVTMLIRPCGGRFAADGDDQGEDDDDDGDVHGDGDDPVLR